MLYFIEHLWYDREKPTVAERKMLDKIKLEKYLIIPDVHLPFHDKLTLNSVYNLAKDLQPDIIVQLGDLIDCYALSNYSKDPNRLLTFQKEIDLAINFWKKLHQICPNSQKYYKLGNHERRFQNILYSNPQLSPLKALNLASLMDLDKYEVKMYDEHEKLIFNDKLVITHGTYVSGISGQSAMKEMNNRRQFGVSGHVHRAGKVFDTKGDGCCCWVESGFLGDLEAGFEFMGDKSVNWQQSITVASMWKKDDVWDCQLDLLEAHDHCFLYNNKMYCPAAVIDCE